MLGRIFRGCIKGSGGQGSPAVAAAAAASTATSAASASIEPGWERVGPLSSLPKEGLYRHELVSKVPVCLVLRKGQIKGALLDVCPHKQASLSEGSIGCTASQDGSCSTDIEDAALLTLHCPKHAKRFPPKSIGFRLGGEQAGQVWVPDASKCNEEFDATWAVPCFDFKITAEGEVLVSSKPIKGTLPELMAKDKKDKEGGQGKEAASTSSNSSSSSSSSAAPARSTTRPDSALTWFPATITSVTAVSLDTSVYRLALALATTPSASGGGPLVLPPTVDRHCWHINLALSFNGTRISREYTPVSPLSDLLSSTSSSGGEVSLLIKHYEKGSLTSLLKEHAGKDSLKIEVSLPDTTLITPQLVPPYGLGPKAKAMANAVSESKEGKQEGAEEDRRRKALLLIAGGTGVAPILQAARFALSEACTDVSRVCVMASSTLAASILARKELAALAREHSTDNRLRVLYFVTGEGETLPSRSADEPFNVSFHAGRITAASLRIAGISLLNDPSLRSSSSSGSAVLAGSGASPDTPAAASLLKLKRVVVSGPEKMAPAMLQAAVEAGLLTSATEADEHGLPLFAELEA